MLRNWRTARQCGQRASRRVLKKLASKWSGKRCVGVRTAPLYKTTKCCPGSEQQRAFNSKNNAIETKPDSQIRTINTRNEKALKPKALENTTKSAPHQIKSSSHRWWGRQKSNRGRRDPTTPRPSSRVQKTTTKFQNENKFEPRYLKGLLCKGILYKNEPAQSKNKIIGQAMRALCCQQGPTAPNIQLPPQLMFVEVLSTLESGRVHFRGPLG